MSSKSHQELPFAWESTTIGEITLPCETIQPRKSPDDEFKYIDIGSIDNSNQTITNPKIFLGKDAPSRARRVVKQRDVVFSTVRTYLKNIACVPDELDGVLTSTGIAVLRTTSEIKNNFLFYYVSSDEFIRKISGEMDGTLYPAVTDNDVYAASIPLPPLNEQKRIVTKIEALQTRSTAVREELEAIKPLLNQFRQSVLAAAFRGDLTKDWREQNPDVEPAEVLLERIRVERRRRWEEAELEKMKAKGKVPKDDKWKKKYKEPEPIDTESLPELPDGWCWVSVEQFADVGTGATPLRKNTKYYDGGIIPWITSGALNEIFIETAEEYITPLAIDETNAKVFPKHTLLIAMYGEGKTRGKVSELLIEAATNQACAALILNGLASKIRPIVKLFFLKNYSDIRKIASGGVQPNLNLGMIKNTLVPLPPMNEQITICALVEQCMLAADNIEHKYQQAEIDLETLNQSILAKAFRGELVPQDSNDEPASVLLERIKEERDKAKATAKKSKTKKKRSS